MQIRTENIIMEFRSTLDHKYPVAEDFDRVYVYLLRRLLEANMKKDKEILEEVNMHLRSMRDTWKEVMRTSKGSQQDDEKLFTDFTGQPSSEAGHIGQN